MSARRTFNFVLLLICGYAWAQPTQLVRQARDVEARELARERAELARKRKKPPAKPKPEPENERKAEEQDHPQQREEWFRGARQSSSGLAAQRRHSAVNSKMSLEHRWRSRAMTAAGAADPSTPAWQELGPRPQYSSTYGYVAGRITAIAPDLVKDPTGNTVYIGTAYGGVWRSNNAMSTAPVFTPLTDGAATLSVGAIALDASTNPTKIYVGTGEPDSSSDSYYGVGVMKSTDGGQSWTVISSSDNGGYSFYGLSFAKLLVDEADPNQLIACARLPGVATYKTVTPGLYRSSDAGATWNLILATPYGCSDLVYQRATATYYAAARGVGVFASTSKGKSWALIGNPTVSHTAPSVLNMSRIALAVRNTELWVLIVDATGNLSTPVPCPSATGVCDTGLSLSNNGGVSFTAMPPPQAVFDDTAQGWYNLYFAAPGNSGTVVVGGIDLWSGTFDGSTAITWTNLTRGYTGGTVHPDQHAFAAVDDSHWLIGNDGGIWTTANAGAEWTNANASIGVIQFTSASGDTQIAGQYFGGSQDNGTALGTASSLQWNSIYGGDGGFTLSSKQFPSRYLTENYFVSLHRSENRGASFQNVVGTETISETSAFYVPYTFAAADESNLLLGTCRVWRGPAAAVDGAGWAPASPDLSLTGSCSSYITALAVAPGNPMTAYAVTRNGYVWQSLNATITAPTWSMIAGYPLPPRPLSSVVVDANDQGNVFVGVQGFGTGHVFRRVNGTWLDISGNLPDVPVNSLVLDPAHPLNLYAATDAGVYMSSDGGTLQTSWQLVGTGLPNVAVLELKIAGSSPRMLLAATHGRGAWALPLDTQATMPAPTLVSPVNASVTTLSTVQFSWTPIIGATAYRIMVTTDPTTLPTDPSAVSCASCAISDAVGTNSYVSSVTLLRGATYTWQVRAVGTQQNGAWSARSTFVPDVAADNLVFFPSLINFGSLGLYATMSQIVQVSNYGPGIATLSSVGIQDMRQYSLLSNCPLVLNVYASCSLQVLFSPQLAVASPTQIVITNAVNNTSASMPVLGAGVYSSFSPDTVALDFGHQALKADSAAKVVTLRNPSGAVAVFAMAASGDFSATADCGTQFAPNSTCLVSIVFRPTQKGTRNGSLVFYDNSIARTHAVSLTGTGEPACGKQTNGSYVACQKPVIGP